VQANIIEISDPAALNMALYPQLSTATVDWLKHNLSAPVTFVPDVAQKLHHQAVQTFHKVNNSLFIKKLKAEIGSVMGEFNNSTIIYPIVTHEDMAKASDLMQNYLLACPAMHKAFYGQRIDAWGRDVPEYEPPVEANPLYQAVVSGLAPVFFTDAQDSEDDKEQDDKEQDGDEQDDIVYVKTFAPIEDRPELQLSDRMDVLLSWNTAEQLLRNGQDPTFYVKAK